MYLFLKTTYLENRELTVQQDFNFTFTACSLPSPTYVFSLKDVNT